MESIYDSNRLKAWQKFQKEIKERLTNSTNDPDRELYDYLLTNIIPDEIEYWEDRMGEI